MSGKALTRLAIAALLSLGAYGRNAMTSEEMQVVHPKFRGASNPMIAELKTKMQKVSPTILAGTSFWETLVQTCAVGAGFRGTLVLKCDAAGPVCENPAGKAACLAGNPACLVLQKSGSNLKIVSCGLPGGVPAPGKCLTMTSADDADGKVCGDKLNEMLGCAA